MGTQAMAGHKKDDCKEQTTLNCPAEASKLAFRDVGRHLNLSITLLRMPMKEASQSEPVNNRTAIDCVQRRCRVQEWSGHERTWRWGFQKFGDVGPQWRGWGPDVWPERCGRCPKISSCIWGLLTEFAYHSKSKGVGLQMAVVSKANLAVADSYMRETLWGGKPNSSYCISLYTCMYGCSYVRPVVNVYKDSRICVHIYIYLHDMHYRPVVAHSCKCWPMVCFTTHRRKG